VVWNTQTLFGVLLIGIYEEVPWGFGQLIGVLLLAAPLLTIAWKFSESYTTGPEPGNSGESQGLRVVEGVQDTTVTRSSATSALHEPQPSLGEIELESLSQIHARPLGHQAAQNSQADLLSNPFQSMIPGDFFKLNDWTWSCGVLACSSLLALTIISFWHINIPYPNNVVQAPFPNVYAPRIRWSIPGFWYSMLPYLIFGYPSGFAFSLLAGIHLETYPGLSFGYKHVVLFFIGAFMHGVYLFQSWVSPIEFRNNSFQDYQKFYLPFWSRVAQHMVFTSILFGIHILMCTSRWMWAKKT
jgi:hypothetical protein